MPNLHIRNVPEKVVAKLKKRAKARGVSLQEEVRTILEAEVRMDIAGWLKQVDAVRERLRAEYGEFESSADLIREDRASR